MNPLWSYESNADGYMIFFAGKPIGGASIKLPRGRALRGKQKGESAKHFRELAQSMVGKCERLDEKKRFSPDIHRNIWNWFDATK